MKKAFTLAFSCQNSRLGGLAVGRFIVSTNNRSFTTSTVKPNSSNSSNSSNTGKDNSTETDSDQTITSITTNQKIDIDGFRRYLLLTSRNRGRVETELFLGGYALNEDRIWKMTMPELLAYNEVLDYTDNELFEYIVGQVEPPEELKNNEEFKRVVEYVQGRGKKHYTDPARKSFNQDYLKGDCSPPSKSE